MASLSAFLSVLFSALADLCSAEVSKTFWVLADAALVRSRPDAKAPAKGSLRTGTYLNAKKASGDWLYLDSVASRPMDGWVHLSLVSESKIDEYHILAQLSEARTLPDSIQWYERLLSILPKLEYSNHLHKRRPELRKALLKGYIASGDTAKAAHLGRQMRGTDPAYVAQCQGRDLLVIGSIDSTGEFQSLLWQETLDPGSRGQDSRNVSSPAIRKKAMGLRMTMAYMEWFTPARGVEPNSLGHIFMTAKIVPPENNAAGYIEDVEGTATFGISLSRSDNVTCQETIYSTKPTYLVPVSGIKRKTELDSIDWYRHRLVGKGFDTSGLARVEYQNVREYGYVDVSVSGVLSDPHQHASQRGIFNGSRQLVWPPEGTAGVDIDITPDHPRFVSRWFRFGPDAGFPAFIILPFNTNYVPPHFHEANGNYGYHLLRIDKQGTKMFTVRSDYGGC